MTGGLIRVVPGLSHTDHNMVSEHQMEWAINQCEELIKQEGGPKGVVIKTIELPADMGTTKCELHGPIIEKTGGPKSPPVTDQEAYEGKRPDRKTTSRLCKRAPFDTQKITVICGPHEGEPCVLYTCYGGPAAKPDKDDPCLENNPQLRAETEEFWKTHALSDPSLRNDRERTAVMHGGAKPAMAGANN